MPDAPETWKAGGLEYTSGADAQVGRRRFRLLLTLTLLNTLMIAGLIVGPYLMPFAREKWQQWQTERALEQERLRIVTFEQKCMAHAWPANQVVYEEDPDAAAKLLALPNGAYEPAVQDYLPAMGSGVRRRSRRGGLFGGDDNAALVVPPGYQPPVRMALPDYFQHFLNFAAGGSLFGGGGGGERNGFTEPALLFLHERTTPGGKKYLVQVCLQPGFEIGSNGTQTDAGSFRSYHVTKYRRLIARAWDVPPAPAQPVQVHEWTTLLALPDLEQLDVAQVPERAHRRASSAPEDVDASAATQPVRINYGNRLRFFAGQIDASDPSHFTIGYQVDGSAGSIDGRMRDSGLVLRPSGGAPAGEELIQKMSSSPDPTVEVWDLTAQPPAR